MVDFWGEMTIMRWPLFLSVFAIQFFCRTQGRFFAESQTRGIPKNHSSFGIPAPMFAPFSQILSYVRQMQGCAMGVRESKIWQTLPPPWNFRSEVENF